MIFRFNKDYQKALENRDVIGLSVWTHKTHEEIGVVQDVLVDQGNVRSGHLVINMGVWIFGKTIIWPVRRSYISFTDQRIYIKGLTREELGNLPEHDT